MSEDKSPVSPSGITFQRSEDFTESYSNNAQFLSSNWDLEIVFGQLDLKQGPNVVVQHSSITVPWPQAKVMLYFLNLHVAAHEADWGRIIVPKGIVAEFPAEKPKDREGIKDEVWTEFRKHYEDFIAKNPEAKP